MKLLISDDEINEKPIIVESNDRGKVIVPIIGTGNHEKLDELSKEIIANDALVVGVREAGRMHDVSKSAVSEYSNGRDVSDDTKTKILSRKHNIAELATTKLMETLGMFDPSNIEKPNDIVRAAKDLSQIAESMSPSNKNNGNGEMHLHLYSPKQRPMKEFDTIDV